jgi:hypothetical protein
MIKSNSTKRTQNQQDQWNQSTNSTAPHLRQPEFQHLFGVVNLLQVRALSSVNSAD